MASAFKMLLAEWAKLRIAEPRASKPSEKYELRTQLDQKWAELLNFPSADMTEDDFELLKHLENWTVDSKTVNKIGGSQA